jgi:hypothetical protein
MQNKIKYKYRITKKIKKYEVLRWTKYQSIIKRRNKNEQNGITRKLREKTKSNLLLAGDDAADKNCDSFINRRLS